MFPVAEVRDAISIIAERPFLRLKWRSVLRIVQFLGGDVYSKRFDRCQSITLIFDTRGLNSPATVGGRASIDAQTLPSHCFASVFYRASKFSSGAAGPPRPAANTQWRWVQHL